MSPCRDRWDGQRRDRRDGGGEVDSVDIVADKDIEIGRDFYSITPPLC